MQWNKQQIINLSIYPMFKYVQSKCFATFILFSPTIRSDAVAMAASQRKNNKWRGQNK